MPVSNRFLLTIIILFFINNSNYAQSDVREKLQKALLNLELNEATKLADYEYDELYKKYLNHHVLFFKTFVKGDISLESFFYSSNEMVSYMEVQKMSAYRNAFLTEMLIERAAIRIYEKSYWPAINELRKVFAVQKSNLKIKQGVFFSYRSQGLLEIIFASVPKKYKWMTDILGFKGDMLKGLEYLKIACKKSEMLSRETEIIYFFVEKSILSDHNAAWIRIDSLRKLEPDNQFYTYLSALNAVERKDNEKAIQLYKEVLNSSKLKDYQYVNYQYAQSLIFKEQYEDARKHLDIFINYNQNPNFKADAVYKKGITYLLQGDITKAGGLFAAVSKWENAFLDKDISAIKRAKQYLNKTMTPYDIDLMRARYLFDGGYLDKSLAILNKYQPQISNLNPDQKVELYYRYGRIYHEKKNYVLTKMYYNHAHSQNATTNLWMRVYACFYLGQLFEEQKDWPNARRYYEQALQYDNYEFQSGLEQKAKAGLERIKIMKYAIPGDKK